MVKKYLSLVVVLVFNLWVWKIFTSDVILGLALILTSIFFWLAFQNYRRYRYIFFIFFIVLLFLQWQTTNKTPLTILDNDEQRLQQVRLRAHPPVNVKIGSKTIWVPTGNWFELRKESIAFYKIKNNFSEIVDLNLFFFANHPRERVGVNEFEKYPYILLPAFLIGLFSVRKLKLLILIAGFSPLLLIAIIGNSNPFGPFSLFPFISAVTALGLEKFHKRILVLPKSLKNLALGSSIIALILIFVQIVAYAKY